MALQEAARGTWQMFQVVAANPLPALPLTATEH